MRPPLSSSEVAPLLDITAKINSHFAAAFLGLAFLLMDVFDLATFNSIKSTREHGVFDSVLDGGEKAVG